jgi:site-specific DNA-methyltransferase (adenine-specific)
VLLDAMAPNSIDACVTDPPYHLLSTVKRFAKSGGADRTIPVKDHQYQRLSRGFMGKEWDGGDVTFQAETWAKVLRVLKPGGYLVAFSAPKCQHRMVCAIEDAGFEIRDGLMWLFGTGFPKSHDVSKGIDALLGAERTKVAPRSVIGHQRNIGNRRPYMDDPNHTTDSDEPITTDAMKWAGWGSALKPAYEPICLARKPLEGTNAQNVLKWGAGALNIDGCRVGAGESRLSSTGGMARKANPAYGLFANTVVTPIEATLGRWPANILHDESDEVVLMFPNSKSSRRTGKRTGILGEFPGQDDATMGHDDSGSAARFFYSAKASKHDRAGSKHPTVKPVNLMRWLCRLVTPLNGLILDPFAGSGTTGAAAHLEGFRAILCEREAEYQADTVNRLRELCGEDPPWVKLQEIASAGAPPWAKLQEAAE